MELFDWDDANLLHIAQHDVTSDEAEHVLTHDPLDHDPLDHDPLDHDPLDHDPIDLDTQVLESEERLAQVGATRHGRIFDVISVARGEIIRVVTAFDAPRKDRLLFELWRGENYATKT